MIIVKNLCEIVQRDRELAGLTQYQLAKKLNKAKRRPIDPFTKKPKLASRTWVAKLEAGLLRRELSLEVRQWLAETLSGESALFSGDSSLYQSLPIGIGPKEEVYIAGNLNILPVVKHLAKSNRVNVTFEELRHLCELYGRCLKIGVSLFDQLEVGKGTLSVKS